MNHELFVKICGITRSEDAALSASLGADAIGMIFYPKSKRFVSPDQAKAIADVGLSLSVSRVGVFVNPTLLELEETVKEVSLDFIQLHGHESPSFVDQARKIFPEHQFIKAVRLGENDSQLEYSSDYELLDSSSADFGGTGDTISWTEASARVKAQTKPILLAGGLTIENVLQAIDIVKPAGIDLSSGVESAPGIKCPEKLKQFFLKLGRGQS